MRLLPFDAHNHVQLGPTAVTAAGPLGLSGMAVMSTHPRDFEGVLGLAAAKTNPDGLVIPCLGVHPWFLHELTAEDWHPWGLLGDEHGNLVGIDEQHDGPPRWIREMAALLEEHPGAPVGEIGLDGFHFSDPATKELSCPMDVQVKALELQLSLAIELGRPVSLHCVRAMGPMQQALARTQKRHGGRLPPAIYFHAFGGKQGTATQLFRSLEKKGATRVCFGFAPIVNFKSPKTRAVVLEAGLDRLVLETDHEDAGRVPGSMELGVSVLAEILGVDEDELVRRTNENARALYGLDCEDNDDEEEEEGVVVSKKKDSR